MLLNAPEIQSPYCLTPSFFVSGCSSSSVSQARTFNFMSEVAIAIVGHKSLP